VISSKKPVNPQDKHADENEPSHQVYVPHRGHQVGSVSARNDEWIVDVIPGK
jgi:hypothetical protein